MIKTFYGLEELVTAPSAATFLAALVIGLAFGFALEHAGFGSSRKLSGIFYFRDMTVLRVMFTALITAMLGLSLVAALGWVDMETQIYVLPSLYGAQIVGGLVFGVGFALSGWCPGTGVVGVAVGKLDALVFLGGVTIGAIIYNETPWLTASLLGQSSVDIAFGMPRNLFALLFTLAAVGAFFGSEWVERQVAGGGKYLNSTFLRGLCVALVIGAVAVFILPSQSGEAGLASSRASSEQALLESVESAADHIEPEELADALMHDTGDFLVIDVRPPEEYAAFHLTGAVNVPLPGLIEYLTPYKNRQRIVLYSNGMTHPAQARDALVRLGFLDVYMLTDGLRGFVDRCLKPVSLRYEQLAASDVERVNAWRSYFLAEDTSASVVSSDVSPATTGSKEAVRMSENDAPRLVSTKWLEENLGSANVRIVDCRTHADYTQGHVPGAAYLNFESIRGDVGGVPSVLLPADLLVKHLSLLGIKPDDMVVFDPGDGVRDATLISMALQRVGHRRWGILHGGFPKWKVEGRSVEKTIPQIAASDYKMPDVSDGFTVDHQFIHQRLGEKSTVIVDTRPSEYFTGEKTREMRAGHIPGAVNRVYKEDLDADGNLKQVAVLDAAYKEIIPSKDSQVIVYCRTGHQASLTFFVLKEVLGYKNVKWYDASWTDWAAREDLPVAP